MMNCVSAVAVALTLLHLGCSDDVKATADATIEVDSRPKIICDETNLSGLLAEIPGVSSVKSEVCDSVGDQAKCFEILFRQPIQHASPQGPGFLQRLQLIHRGCQAPVVAADWGYESLGFYSTELAALAQVNELHIEHRYQGMSVPARNEWDWSALTIANAAADQHEIVTAFRQLYDKNWVMTGASKGGVTALYHRFLYPNDVDGTVAYVAPASRARIDDGYQRHMKENFPRDCVNSITAYQRAALTDRRAMMESMFDAEFGNGASAQLPKHIAMLDWGLWQGRGTGFCSQIPTSAASDKTFYDFFARDLRSFATIRDSLARTDSWSESALSYEWLSEQGFANQLNVDLASLIGKVQTMETDFRADHPGVNLPVFNGSVTAAMRQWIRTKATSVVLIYGEVDPWTGGQLDAPTGQNSAKFIAPNRSHEAGIATLSRADKTSAAAMVRAMLGVQQRSALSWNEEEAHSANLARSEYFKRHEQRLFRRP